MILCAPKDFNVDKIVIWRLFGLKLNTNALEARKCYFAILGSKNLETAKLGSQRVMVESSLLSSHRPSPSHLCYASINSKREHPPRANPRGNFLRWSKALPRGKIFLQKHGPRGKETPTPGEYFRRSRQLFLLIGVEILGFCRNQT